jgi:hypothetical protein
MSDKTEMFATGAPDSNVGPFLLQQALVPLIGPLFALRSGPQPGSWLRASLPW